MLELCNEGWCLCTSPQLDISWKLLPSSAIWQWGTCLTVCICKLFTKAALTVAAAPTKGAL